MRMCKRSKLIVVIICLWSLLAASVAVARFGGGEAGTEDDPFLIDTAAELRALGALNPRYVGITGSQPTSRRSP